MTFAIDMVTNCSIVTVALFLAVNVKCPGRTWVRTHIARPAHRTVATSGDGMAVTLERDSSSRVVLINYCHRKSFHQGIFELLDSSCLGIVLIFSIQLTLLEVLAWF